jgi:hypothetical protein
MFNFVDFEDKDDSCKRNDGSLKCKMCEKASEIDWLDLRNKSDYMDMAVSFLEEIEEAYKEDKITLDELIVLSMKIGYVTRLMDNTPL